jgi:inosine/xanthosine triphosphatase
MFIIIASTRIPKINGVKKAVGRISSHFGIDQTSISFVSVEAQSGVSDTPKSIEELMLGAEQRAKKAFQKKDTERVFSVGVEGGLFMCGEKVFLQSWVCVYDGAQCHFGSSGSIELPRDLAKTVIIDGIDLGTAIDKFAQQVDIRSKQGTFGILTRDLITREDSFEEAAIFALTPLFNHSLY